MAKAQPKRISNRPSQAEEGGGLPSDFDAVIKEARYTTWEEAGPKALVGGRDADDPALMLVLEMEDETERNEFLSAGKANRVQPGEDGEFLVPAEGLDDDKAPSGLSASSNANIFLTSVVKADFDEDKLDEGISSLAGIKAHFVRVPQPKREGVARAEGDAPKRPPTVLTISEIYPDKKAGKKAGAGAKPAAKATGKKAVEPEADDEDAAEGDEVTEAAQAVVAELLEDPKFKKGIPKAKLFTAVFNKLSKDKAPNKKEIVALVQDEDFLGDGPWTYDAEAELLTAAE